MRTKRRNRKKDKTHCQREHFKRRVRERYGINVNRHLYRLFLEKIWNGESEMVERQSHTRSVHRIMTFYGPMYVVYDSLRKEFNTALPYDETRLYYKERHDGNSRIE
jgi:hypothetical protein